MTPIVFLVLLFALPVTLPRFSAHDRSTTLAPVLKPPSTIGRDIGGAQSEPLPHSHKRLLPLMDCDTCEEIMLRLWSAWKQGAKVDAILSEACNPYSDVSKSMCEDFIHTNKPQLNNLLQNQEQSDLCGELDFCVRKEEARLLGLNECTWGPSHWCSSRETAVKCKTVDYCEKHGWG